MKYVIANWKMNPSSLSQAKQLLKQTRSLCTPFHTRVHVIIAPPFVYLSELNKLFGTLEHAAQDVFWAERGAYTGEISAAMLKKVGVKYVNIGHIERRIFARETDEIIAKKIKASLSSNLKPILCVGGDDKANKNRALAAKKALVKKQLKVLQHLNANKLSKTLIAYEPQGAIGTGQVTANEEIQTMISLIKKMYPLAKVIYGGSVRAGNAKRLFNLDDLDGVLVGGASLNPKEFAKIVETASLG